MGWAGGNTMLIKPDLPPKHLRDDAARGASLRLALSLTVAQVATSESG